MIVFPDSDRIRYRRPDSDRVLRKNVWPAPGAADTEFKEKLDGT